MNDDSGLHPTAAGKLPDPAGDAGRYRPIADGTAHDRLLDRDVALRTAPLAGADDLQHEARFLARLDHAGLPCVHDFVRRDDGAVLVTRPLGGRTLAQALAAAAGGESVPAIAGHTACVLTFLKVCEALVAAHLRGVVHHALTPDAIILGDDGQVVVDGWGRAMSELERPATLRFIANAPVPVALPPDGLHEDIRGLGTCMHTALTRDAALPIPAPLAAVVRRAMESDAATGYASVGAVRDELARFLAGQAPQAFKPGPLSGALHWLEIHRRAVLVATLAVLLAGGAALAYGWNEVRTYAAWGQPLVDERFADNSWKDRWTPVGDGWELRDGRLISTAEYESRITFRKRLASPLAIEYTGRIEAGARPGDLSVVWSEAGDEALPPWQRRGFAIQAGAHDNSWCAIFATPGGQRMAHANVQLEPGRDHRFRVEIDGGLLRMWIDGRQVLEHNDAFPTTSGNLHLMGYYPGKSFDDVRIWQREVPSMVSPLAVGDSWYQAGRFAEAAEHYLRVAQSQAGSTLGDQAYFRRGLALTKAADRDGAKLAWSRIADPLLRRRADCLAIDALVELGEPGLAAERFLGLWKSSPEVHGELRQRWQIGGQKLMSRRPLPEQALAAWLELRQQTLADDRPSEWLAAEMLLRLERWEEVLTRFPEERRAAARALFSLGRPRQIHESTWAISHERIQAMVSMGLAEQALASPLMHRDMRRNVLCKLGRAAELGPATGLPAIIYQQTPEQILARSGLDGYTANHALVLAGRLDLAAGAGLPTVPGSGHFPRAMVLLGLHDEAEAAGQDVAFPRLIAALAAGRIEDATARRRALRLSGDAKSDGRWFGQTVGIALVDAALGDGTALRKALEQGVGCEAHGRRRDLVCAAALAPSSAEVLAALPWTTERTAWVHVADALRAELAGDRAAARAAWSRFRDLPAIDRLLDGHLPYDDLEATAAWRAAAP